MKTAHVWQLVKTFIVAGIGIFYDSVWEMQLGDRLDAHNVGRSTNAQRMKLETDEVR